MDNTFMHAHFRKCCRMFIFSFQGANVSLNMLSSYSDLSFRSLGSLQTHSICRVSQRFVHSLFFCFFICMHVVYPKWQSQKIPVFVPCRIHVWSKNSFNCWRGKFRGFQACTDFLFLFFFFTVVSGQHYRWSCVKLLVGFLPKHLGVGVISSATFADHILYNHKCTFSDSSCHMEAGYTRLN